MAARTLLVVLLFVGTGLAGCISGDDPTEEGPTLNNTETGPSTEMPDGREGKIVAFEETNLTESGSGGIDHHHDQWNGQSRVTLFDMRQAMEPTTDDQNRAFVIFNVPQPGLVFEGTGQVEFTLSNPQRRVCEGAFTLGGHYVCTDYIGAPVVGPIEQPLPDPTGGPTGLMLRYRHGSASEFIDAGPIAWGTPTVIKIDDPRQTDMPHSTASLWQFMVVSPNPHDVTLVFQAKAEIVRSDAADIPLWPGHPLFYTEDKHWRDIHQGSHTGAGTGVSSTSESETVRPQRLISYGTRTVYIWVNITDLQAPNPLTAPVTWFLWHTNASGISNITNPFDMVNHSAEKKSHLWILPVTDNDMDSPYQDGSRWQFELRGSMTTPDPTGDQELPVIGQFPQFACYGGCADYVVKYDITIRATDQEDPNAEIFCEDDRIC